jgi:hypothetical protein
MLSWFGRRLLAGALYFLQSAALSSSYSVVGELRRLEAEELAAQGLAAVESAAPLPVGMLAVGMPSGHPERLMPMQPLSDQEMQLLEQFSSRRWAHLLAALDRVQPD